MKDKKEELLLSQWQTCVEMANSISQRRDTINSIFISLNLAITAAFSIVWDIKSLLLLFFGVVICTLWYITIRNFKILNTEKFKIINEIEKKLPVQPFNDEWNGLKNNKKYIEGTKIESW